jgi:hypothetical protein
VWHCEREKWFIHDSYNETASRCGLKPMTAAVTNFCTALLQDVSREKVNVLEYRPLGKKSSYEHMSNSEWLPTQSCLGLQIQKHFEC